MFRLDMEVNKFAFGKFFYAIAHTLQVTSFMLLLMFLEPIVSINLSHLMCDSVQLFYFSVHHSDVACPNCNG